MRHVFYGMMCLMIVYLTLLMMLTIDGRGSRETELEDAVSLAMKGTMNALEKGSVKNDEEVKEILESRMKEMITSESEVKITNLEMDMQMGIMQVLVEETFTYPNGKEGTIEVKKTAILD